MRDRGARQAPVAVGARFERPGQRQVQLRAFAGQQVVVEHLAKQRMAEAEALVLLRVGTDASPMPRAAPRATASAQRSRLGEADVVGAPGDGEQPEALASLWAEPLEAGQQGLTQRRRQRAATVETAGEKLLGEQRVALAAIEQAPDDLVGGSAAEDVGELGRDLVAVEGRSSSRRAQGPRSSSLSRGRRGWRRCSSSERYVQTTRTRSSRRLEARKARKERVERSAQWRSSSQNNTACSRRARRAARAGNRTGGAELRRHDPRRAQAPARRAPAPAGPTRRARSSETIERRVGRTGERAHGAHKGGVGKLVLTELDALAADRADAGRLCAALELRQQS